MISTVKSRPNHYAVLGIKPSATDEEIAQAFISKMFSPRPMAQAALVGAAYETLRNPAKRRAYDASLGFRPEPQPFLSKPLVTFSATARYVPLMPVSPFEQPAAGPAPSVAPRPEPEALPEPAPAPKPEPDIAAILTAEPLEPLREPRESAFEWRRPAVIAGALVAVVGLVGAWAGSLAGNDVEAEQVTMALPKAKPAAAATPAAEAQRKAAEARPYVPQRRIERARTRSALADLPLEDLSHGNQADAGKSPQHSYYQTTAPDGTTEIAAAEAPPLTSSAEVTAAAAAMPLPRSVIARTIHKIGYSCGQVASTSAVDGQAGVFNVTCSSGQSYRASPIHGRYRFKKL
jgi:hypothetical protein